MTKVLETIRVFAKEEDGVALTEYLILLALLVGGVIVAVTAAGGDLASAWESWGSWWSTNVDASTIGGTDTGTDTGTEPTG